MLTFQGNILVEGRLWMAHYRSYFLLDPWHMFILVLPSLILKSAGYKKEDKVTRKYTNALSKLHLRNLKTKLYFYS